METHDRDTLLEKLYDHMEQDLQVGSTSVGRWHTICSSVLSSKAEHWHSVINTDSFL